MDSSSKWTQLHSILQHHCRLGNSTAVACMTSQRALCGSADFWKTCTYFDSIAHCLILHHTADNHCSLSPLELFHLLKPTAACAAGLLDSQMSKLAAAGMEDLGPSQMDASQGKGDEASLPSDVDVVQILAILRVHQVGSQLDRKRPRESDDERPSNPTLERVAVKNIISSSKPTTAAVEVDDFDQIDGATSNAKASEGPQRRRHFTPEEDRAIIEGYSKFSGNYRFQTIFDTYRHVWQPGRTYTQLHDHWRSTLRHQSIGLK